MESETTPVASPYNDDNSVIIQNTSLGFKVPVRVPKDLATFDAVFGAGSALQLCVTHVLYHNWNGQFRDGLAEALVRETSIPIPTVDGTTDGDPVSEAKYLAFLYTQKKEDGVTPVLTQIRANEIALEVALGIQDVMPRESTRGQGKRSKEVISLGTQVFQQINSGERTLDSFIAKFEAANPGVSFSSLGEPTVVETFIEAIHVNYKRAAEEARRAAQASAQGLLA